MIKDKITPVLKNAFIESIDKTKTTHREQGFYMCLGRDEKLSPFIPILIKYYWRQC